MIPVDVTVGTVDYCKKDGMSLLPSKAKSQKVREMAAAILRYNIIWKQSLCCSDCEMEARYQSPTQTPADSITSIRS